MACGEELFKRRFFCNAVWAVFSRLAAFVAHHVLLVGQGDVVHLIGHVAQHVGLDPQAKLQLFGGQSEEVVGAVKVGGTIGVGATHGVHQFVGLAACNVFGTRKHKVLKQVGKTGLSNGFIAWASVHPQIECDQRQTVIFHQNNLQAVAEFVLLVADGEAAVVGLHRT